MSSVHRRKDRRWTLDRGKSVIAQLFHLTYTIHVMRKLLVHNGWTCEALARRAVARDDDAAAGRIKKVWLCTDDSGWPVEPGPSPRTKPDPP
ncbi:winged helix-turn-helix domain-containing protein [Streptomyces sp. NPDC087851]|uniref:winged helix-turn-helix domain-containing protein n=1 Tax=Streptomyces sp. NPDC087851 TaxID=3365810 RepID=UPI00380202F0